MTKSRLKRTVTPSIVSLLDLLCCSLGGTLLLWRLFQVVQGPKSIEQPLTSVLVIYPPEGAHLTVRVRTIEAGGILERWLHSAPAEDDRIRLSPTDAITSGPIILTVEEPVDPEDALTVFLAEFAVPLDSGGAIPTRSCTVRIARVAGAAGVSSSLAELRMDGLSSAWTARLADMTMPGRSATWEPARDKVPAQVDPMSVSGSPPREALRGTGAVSALTDLPCEGQTRTFEVNVSSVEAVWSASRFALLTKGCEVDRGKFLLREDWILYWDTVNVGILPGSREFGAELLHALAPLARGTSGKRESFPGGGVVLDLLSPGGSLYTNFRLNNKEPHGEVAELFRRLEPVLQLLRPAGGLAVAPPMAWGETSTIAGDGKQSLSVVRVLREHPQVHLAAAAVIVSSAGSGPTASIITRTPPDPESERVVPLLLEPTLCARGLAPEAVHRIAEAAKRGFRVVALGARGMVAVQEGPGPETGEICILWWDASIRGDVPIENSEFIGVEMISNLIPMPGLSSTDWYLYLAVCSRAHRIQTCGVLQDPALFLRGVLVPQPEVRRPE